MGILVSFSIHANVYFHYEKDVIVMKDKNSKPMHRFELNGNRIEFLDEIGERVSFKIEPDELCKTPEGIEPWTYHRNQDGTYGLVGINVTIAAASKKQITIKNSSICGYTSFSGYVLVEHSQIYGGGSPSDKLVINGAATKKSAQLIFREVEASKGSSGKIAGKVDISRTTLEGNIEIDSCSNYSSNEDCNSFDQIRILDSTINDGVNIYGPMHASFVDFNGDSEYSCRSFGNCSLIGYPDKRSEMNGNNFSGSYRFLETDAKDIIADGGSTGNIEVYDSILGEDIELDGRVNVFKAIIGNDVVIRGNPSSAPDCEICIGINISEGSYIVGSNIYLNGWITIFNSVFHDNVYVNAQNTSNIGLSFLKNTHISGTFFSNDWNLEGRTFIGRWGCDEVGGGCREIPEPNKNVDHLFSAGFRELHR